MLYDPSWELKTKTDPFSLSSLIAWLETHPATKSYRFHSNGQCLLAQYFTAAGFKNVCMFSSCFWHGKEKIPAQWSIVHLVNSGRGTSLPEEFNKIAQGTNRTFGGALRRARAMLAKREDQWI